MVKNFVILPDVNCDLGESLRHEYDIEYINGHIKTPDGKRSGFFELGLYLFRGVLQKT